jgi:phytoene desaturase
MLGTQKKIAVIGGGVGGVATAALLAKDGHEVHLFEKNHTLGGRANVIKSKGFTFDIGPSWYLMPDVFERFFAEFGTSSSKLLKLKEIDPQYRIFFSDKTHMDIPRDAKKTRALFESIEKGAGKQFDKFLAESKFKYELSMKTVLYKNADNIWDFFSPELLKHGRELHVFQSMESYVNSFFKNEKLRQIVQYTLVFLGGSPANTPALYSLMTHIDFNLGVFYPDGGFYTVIEAIVSLARKHGVTFHLDSPVSSIEIKEGQASSIKVAGKKIKFDAVISNADFAHTESLFSQPEEKMFDDKYWQKKDLSPSAFLLFLGVKGTLPTLHHHNIYFGKSWMEHFATIFDKPDWPQSPSLYINVPSMTDPTVAPKGHHNMMILVPIASRLKETEAWREGYSEFVLRYVEDQLGVSLRKKIVYKKIFSISDFEKNYNSVGGNALGGLAHTLLQTGPFRTPNKHKKVKNLFFVGANTVPGIGVPPCLISAHLMRDRIRTYFK